MSDLEKENKRLRQENTELRDKNNQSQTTVKLIAFFGVLGVCYLVEPHSQIAAVVISIGAFYFCFMR